MTKALITAMFLSQVLMGDFDAGRSNYTRLVDNNPFSGARSFNIILDRDGFTPKAPIPYYWYWDNNLNQTAQQYVAILSLLQEELDAVDQSPTGQELQRLKERIEEKVRRRSQTNP